MWPKDQPDDDRGECRCARSRRDQRPAESAGRALVTVRRSSSRAIFALVFAVTACGQDEPPRDAAPSTPDISEEAPPAPQIDYLPVAAFPAIPVNVRERLESEGCRIPQVPDFDEPHNVIQGRFASPDQEDWAALCSRDGTSEILVIWGGPVRCEGPLAPGEDRGVLQGNGRGGMDFSRLVTPADPERMLQKQRDYDGPPPPDPLTHQGIEDHFVGKASVIRYCHEGVWLRLRGAD